MKLFLSLLLVLMPLCASQEQTKKESSVPIKDLLNAPAELMLENKTVRLTAYAWRDFAPGLIGDPRPLMVSLKLETIDKTPLPGGVRLDRVWIIFGEAVWEVSDLRNRIPNQDHAEDSWIKCSHKPDCEISIREGPLWQPGVEVIGVLRFTDGEGRQHFLQAPKHAIVAAQ